MSTVAMLSDIQGQPASLRQVCAHQFGAGASDLRTAATTLSDARRIIFTGMGSSFFAGLPAVHHLAAHGVAAEAMETSELLHFGLETLCEGTVVVLVSRSGETVEAIRLLPELLKRGAKVIGVTNVADSVLARESACSIFLNSRPDRMVAVQSYSASLAVLLLLAGAQGLDRSKRYVSCYSSQDLVNWTFRNDVLKLSDPENFGPTWILERPKVFYNAKTQKFYKESQTKQPKHYGRHPSQVIYAHPDYVNRKTFRAVFGKINGAG